MEEIKELKKTKKWILRGTDAECVPEILKIAKETGLSELTARLLYIRGYRTSDAVNRFLRMEETSLHDPFLMQDMEKAVRRLKKAIDSKEMIAIYGDYDVDGVTSVSLLYLYLLSEGANVIYDIPNREKDGYGLSLQTVDRLKSKNADLIVTVDNGITATKEALYARELGMEMIVTDHHTCLEQLPDVCAVINPHRPGDQYPFRDLAGVGVVFKLVCAMEMMKCRINGTSELEEVRTVCRKYADLAALGTVADVMPICDENRLIVAMGIRRMEGECRIGIRALMETASVGKSIPNKITSSYIGYLLAPRMNAAGRVGSAMLAVELLLSEEEEKAKYIAQELCRLNSVRKTEEERIFEEACLKIEEIPKEEREMVLVLDDDTWHQGVIGIVSSKITERYGLPSILISYDGQTDGEPLGTDIGKGSGRSIQGLNLVNALTACDDLLERFGGHALAAGLSLQRANVPEFRKRINAYAKSFLSEGDCCLSLEADCEVETDELTLQTAREFNRMEPFGTSNPVPCFILRDAVLTNYSPMGGGKHLRLNVKKDGVSMLATWFWNNETDLPVDVGESVDLLFQLEVNEFRGQCNLQLNLQDILPARSVTEQIIVEKERYAEIRNGAFFSHEEGILPEREDFALVYQFLQREFRMGRTSITLRRLMTVLSDSNGEPFHYAKLKYIFSVFQELSICALTEPVPDYYLFEIAFQANKTSLEKSSLLRHLRSQQRDENGPLCAAGENL